MCASAPRAASRAALDAFRDSRDALQAALENLVEQMDVPDHLVDWGHVSLVQNYLTKLSS